MRRKIPSTGALIAFESAARHESFTKAAVELAQTQSAVCRQVASLEAFLGVRLFRRSRRGVTLTEAGISYSRQVAGRLDEVERDTLSVMTHEGSATTIELAVVPTFATKWLVPRLATFLRGRSDWTVNMDTRTRPFLFDDTGFDAAIYCGDAGWPGTEALFLLKENLVPVCSPRLLGSRKRLSPAAIAGLPLLQQSTRPYSWRRWFASVDMRVPRDMSGPRFELFSMLAHAAVHEMGVALVPPMMVEQELAAGSLVIPFAHDYLSERAYYLIYPERALERSGFVAFRDWLHAQAAQYSASLVHTPDLDETTRVGWSHAAGPV